MPGIYGWVGPVADTVASKLDTAFLQAWPGARTISTPFGHLGAHSFGDRSPAARLPNGDYIGVDGEWSLYEELATRAKIEGLASRVREIRIDGRPHPHTGNVVMFLQDGHRACIASDPTGTFPLYYHVSKRGLLFSSLLRPLARAVNARMNTGGIVQFLRHAHIVGADTFFEGVFRLRPGQRLDFSETDGLKLHDCSTAWSGVEYDGSSDEAADRLWHGLLGAVARTLPPAASTLMMSGGWDSRTLLAAIRGGGQTISCYSHGDSKSRELRIVREICAGVGVSCVINEIDEQVLSVDSLEAGFTRSENVVFPHWHQAGRILESSSACVTAGVMGEVMGGHYGPAMLGGTLQKIKSVASLLVRRRGFEAVQSFAAARQVLLESEPDGLHPYLNPEILEPRHDAVDSVNTAIETELKRYMDRGVVRPTALVEAFVTEHRAVQYVSAQLLSCRAHLDVALPFGGSEVFELATRIPLWMKVHNRLNRKMLQNHADDLLHSPLAATLAPASAPIGLQEASRVVRKALNQTRNALALRSGGRVAASRAGWVNFETFRSGRALGELVASLRCPFWNHERLNRTIASLTDHRVHPHPVYDQFSKILTVDMMVR